MTLVFSLKIRCLGFHTKKSLNPSIGFEVGIGLAGGWEGGLFGIFHFIRPKLVPTQKFRPLASLELP